MLNLTKFKGLLQVLAILLVISSFLSFNVNIRTVTSTDHSSPFEKELTINSFENIKVLAIIANNFGDAYFWVKTQFESWGCNFTTAGLSAIVASCPEYPPRPVTADILIADVTDEILAQFDCVYVPAGAHWSVLYTNSLTLNLLTKAYDLGLVISTLCIGNRIVAHTDIFNDVKTVYYALTYSEMVNAGAIIVHGVGVVSDKRVVTAGTGTCGYVNPYIYPFCVAIVKEVLGYSAAASIQVGETPDATNNYTIAVEINDLTGIFYGNLSAEIDAVKAEIFWNAEQTDKQTFYLEDNDGNGIYEGTFNTDNEGWYIIDIHIYAAAWGVEVLHDDTTMKSGISTSSSLFLLVISSCLLLIIKKRKN
ncbi:MAG: DJ-1/PfpI family protein [Candidatus Thorarchaeota archaeon]